MREREAETETERKREDLSWTENKPKKEKILRNQCDYGTEKKIHEAALCSLRRIII